MTIERRPIVLPNIVIGLGIMSLGAVLTLSTLGLVDARVLLRFWPALLVLLGAAIVAQAIVGRAQGSAPDTGSGHWWLVAIIVLVAVGAAVDQRRAGTAAADDSDSVTVHAIMSRQQRISTPDALTGATMTSVMGSSALDLRQAVVPPGGEVAVEVFALMGGLDLIVPPEWIVDVRTVTIMGGVDDARGRTSRRRRRGDDSEPAQTAAPPVPAPAAPSQAPSVGATPRVVVSGFIMMGGLNINP